MTRYEIQMRNGDWQSYQSLNATNDRAAARCYAAWLADITPHARSRFRLAKLFSNPEHPQRRCNADGYHCTPEAAASLARYNAD